MSKTNTDLAKYEFKKALEELRNIKGRGTELISLYIPPDRQISDVVAYLRDEYSQSSNIKSKSTRKNVTSAIESIMSRLKGYRVPPDNGLVLFVGHKAIGGDKTEMVAYVLEPPEPINIYTYRCDSLFFLEPLEDMLKEKKSYGLITIDRSEATIGILRGKKIEVVKYIESRVPRKHHKGGQSSVRFARLIEEAAHNFFKKVGEIASNAFLEEKDLRGILVGGPGATKEYFISKDYLHHELKRKVLKLLDTGYTDEYGLKELVDKATETFKELDVRDEKAVMEHFMKEVRKNTGSLAVYGIQEVMDALSENSLGELIISEEIRAYNFNVKCPACGKEDIIPYISSDLPESRRKCPQCGAVMEVTDKEDLIEELVNSAERSGCKVHFISAETDLGSSLITAFGGIAGIRRY